MDVVFYQVLVFLISMLILIVVILGVYMDQALQNANQALADLNAIITNLPVSGPDRSADIQAIADGIVAAGQSLKTKFNV